MQKLESWSESEGDGFVLCRNCVAMHLAVWLQTETLPRHHGTDIRIRLWRTFIGRWRHFCSELHWRWQYHRWYYWHKLYTVDWQYKLSTYCTCSAQVCKGSQGLQQTDTSHIKNEPSLISILTARQGSQAPSTSQLTRLDTRHNRHWFMQCKRIQCCVWSTCIYEDQLTLTL